MSCFPCFSSKKPEDNNDDEAISKEKFALTSSEANKPHTNGEGDGSTAAQIFTFRELAAATKNFRPECLLGEGGFGRVYKGRFEKTEQVVAVKQLDRNGLHGNKEFVGEVLRLSLLQHPNLVKLIGYCSDGDQRLLVYEYMSGGSLEHHLFEKKGHALNWFTRMKIASGAAEGLEYLHDRASPPVMYRDFKSSNILLDEEFNPKLSDIGLARLGPCGDKMHLPTRVMGTYGYCAPEYARSGDLTVKSDVYSFGVVLLELITGRRVMDTTRPTDEQNLVTWAQPFFRDPKKFPDMADPLLNRQFPERDLNQAIGVAAMCLQEEASVRPLISDIVAALSFLAAAPPEGISNHVPVHDDNNSSTTIVIKDEEDQQDLEIEEDAWMHSEEEEEGSEEDDDVEKQEKEWALVSRISHNESCVSSGSMEDNGAMEADCAKYNNYSSCKNSGGSHEFNSVLSSPNSCTKLSQDDGNLALLSVLGHPSDVKSITLQARGSSLGQPSGKVSEHNMINKGPRRKSISFSNKFSKKFSKKLSQRFSLKTSKGSRNGTSKPHL